MIEMIEMRNLCPKGHEMDLRMVEVREDENDDSSKILCWLMFGVCGDCSRIIMQGIHKEKIEPTEGIDFIIINERCEKGSSLNAEEVKDVRD